MFCGNCWGYWLTHESFTQIMNDQIYTFGEEEKRHVLAAWSDHDDSQLALSPSASCPECGEPMVQEPAADYCPIVIDRCSQHGVWLDTSEIKQIQVFLDARK